MKRIAVIGTMTNNRSPAFTLIESLVVIAMIGIMTAIAVPVYDGVVERAHATKDLINLRQLGTATQLYMNDNNGVFPGSATATWMSQLELNKKYLPTWRVLQSPFDKRPPSDSGDVVSYGINANIVAISADKITNPVTFIVFAPAQTCTPTVTFLGKNDPADPKQPPPGVTVVDDKPYPVDPAVCSPPDDKVKAGTHGGGTKINAVFADWHVETMAWSAFKNPGNGNWSP
jgi:prepilin-type N-terminal cleavage/methylation domain-containing protein/prepilin-type processing-associated H-X9-DG protein